MIRNLKYNTSIAKTVNYNSSEPKIIAYNGTIVYGTPVLELFPWVVDHSDSKQYPQLLYSLSTEYYPSSFYICGNTNFFVKVKKNYTGEINITSNDSHNFVYKIDDLGYGVLRCFGYNNWVGDSLSSYGESNIVFSSSVDSSAQQEIKFLWRTNETTTQFSDGLFTNKIIRIPYSGYSCNINIYLFPYNFESSYYSSSNFKFAIIDCSKVGFGGVGSYSPVITEWQTEDTQLTIFDSFIYNIKSHDYLNRIINVAISENNNRNTYRETYLVCRSGNRSFSVNRAFGIHLHFIQEYYSPNRIYYGTVPTDPLYSELYIQCSESERDNYKYHVYFQFASSEIVSDSKSVHCNALNNDDTRCNIMCVPKALGHTIESNNTNATYTILSDSYYWGDQEYVVYKLNTEEDAIYNLQISQQ